MKVRVGSGVKGIFFDWQWWAMAYHPTPVPLYRELRRRPDRLQLLDWGGGVPYSPKNNLDRDKH